MRRPALETMRVYRVGSTGLRVVHADGSASRHAPFSLVWFRALPRRVVGSLSDPQPRRGGYQTQELRPEWKEAP